MKYDKSSIFENAWVLFNNDTLLSDLEYVWDFGGSSFRKATFAECLKEAWAIEKTLVDRLEAKKADAENSEEVKAWDWACRKLGVKTNISAVDKMDYVDQMYKEAWPGSSVWSVAMRAVKLHTKINQAA